MLALQLLLTVAASHAADLDFAGAQIVVGEQATDTEVFAARELSRYFRLVCGQVSPVKPAAGAGPAVVVSVPRETRPPGADDQTYILRMVNTAPPRLLVSGYTPIGVQYAAYSLLEKLGAGFYLGGDALPDRREKLLLPADLNEVKTPVFRIRGSLPWYNFLNSPTTWDLEDYQFFFDQMAKMKDNFVGFHSYDSEPFCAYPYEGQWRMGASAATSMTYGWGPLRHMKTSEFGFGTGRYFPYDVFGSRSVALAAEPAKPSPDGALFPHRTLQDDAIIRAQCVLAQGLQYAKWRGVKVCLGFELVGDPTDPEQRRQEEARIRHVLATYPMLDYVWFWQSEGLGGGSNPNAADTPLDLIVQRMRPAFEYLGDENRIHEAARVAAWVQWAHSVAKRLRPDIKVIVSGWGGDAWMRFSDFYIGLDQVLPKDIIFSALDNIDPTAQPHVSEAYGKLSPEREKWPIPWFESDGGGTRRDQWGPQCNVKPFTALVRDAQAKGSQGLLGIHWETRGVEEVAAYCAQFAWDPDLTYEDFYRTFARKCFGEKHAEEMAQILMRLESLGPRWTGGPGQVECGGFEWFSDGRRPIPERMAQLAEMRERIQEIGFVGPGMSRHQGRAAYLWATAKWELNFDRAALALAPDGPIARLLADADAARQAGDAGEARRLAEDALNQMAATSLCDAMQTYAIRLTSQSDFGNLATINVKAYAALLDLWERASVILDRNVPPDADSGPPDLELTAKFPPSALPEGLPYPVHAVVSAVDPTLRVALGYRRPGGPWRYRKMSPEGRAGFVADIPGEFVGPEGVEFYVEASIPHRVGTRRPFGWPEVVYSASALPYRGPAVYGPYLQRQVAMAPWGGAGGALRATVLSAIEYDPGKVEARIGGRIVAGQSTYHFAVFPLEPGLLSQPKLAATCRAADVAGHTSLGAASEFATPGPPSPPNSVAADIAGPFHARVTWSPVGGAATYEVHRSDKPGFAPNKDTLLAEWPWSVYDDITAKPNTTYEYAVIAVDDAGQRSEAARSRELPVPDQPLAKAPTGLTATPGLGRVTLQWRPTGEPVSGYAVFVRREEGGDWERVSGARPVKGTQYVVGGVADTRPRLFAVRAVDRAGRDGETAEAVRAAALPTPQEPVFATSLSSTKADTGQEGRLNGKATIHDGVLDTREGGWIAYPGQELLQVSGPLSVELWVNVDRIEAMPVVLSFGHWDGPGYWLQLFGGGVRFYLPVQRILDTRPPPPLGSWHHLACTYDGQTSRTYLDGKETGSLETGPIDLAPWGGELRIGQYSDLGAEFQTRAQIDEVHIYQRALSADEVRRDFESGRR